MPGKKRKCTGCEKVMRSDNLKSHERNCKAYSDRSRHYQLPNPDSIIKTDVLEPVKRNSNPKIEALVDAIINDGLQNVSDDEPAAKRVKYSKSSPEVSKMTPPSTLTLSEIIVSDDDPAAKRMKYSKSSPEVSNMTSPTLTLSEIIRSPPKQSIIKDTDDDDQNDVDGDIYPDKDELFKVKFLPSTKDDLFKRFNQLFIEFWREQKHQNRNELMAILDELLRQKYIEQETYTKVSDLIAPFHCTREIDQGNNGAEESAEDNDDNLTMVSEEENEENILKEVIDEVFHYIIVHDKNELDHLLEELKNDDVFAEEVHKLKILVDEYIDNKYRGNVLVMDDINKLLTKLSSSKITSKATLHRVQMLLREIEQNRDRIQQVIRRMGTVFVDNVDGKEVVNMLKRLAKEDLLSHEQYTELSSLENMLDMEKLIGVMKEAKIGRGLDFMPRKTIDIWKKLRNLLAEFNIDGESEVRNELLALMDELMTRKELTKKEYDIIISLNNI